MNTLETLNFNNRFVTLGGEFYQAKNPVPANSPSLVAFNPEVSGLLGLNPAEAGRPEFAQVFGGNRVPEGAQPLAMQYSGFQFGSYNPQLGDGRGLLLGEIDRPGGGKIDLYLKGCGQTRFCRGFDGRATLKSSIREFLAGEALAGLGIASTRALAVVALGELIYRELPEPSAVLTRVAGSHIRFGNFDYFHYSNQPDKVTRLADHVIEQYFPGMAPDPERYRLLFREVVDRTARMIAGWQSVGFAHGVMNTDNMSILGETFDFGPFGFMDRFDPGFIPNHSDNHGRYAYGRQPEIGYWNLAKLGETLGHLLSAGHLQEELDRYKVLFNLYHAQLMGRKLGLTVIDSEFERLLTGLFRLLYGHRPDYTNFFRLLARHRTGSQETLREYFIGRPENLDAWLADYAALLDREDISPEEQQSRMEAANPRFVLRNYLAQRAIDRALKDSDFSEIERLRILLQNPYSDPAESGGWPIDPGEYAVDTPEDYLGMQISCSA